MLTEDEGVRAIIALQKINGIKEPEERARKNWRTFADWEKLATEQAYGMFCAKGGGDARN